MAGLQIAGGSDYFLEVLSQTLEYVYVQTCSPADGAGGLFAKTCPSHLVVVADNTVKSAKNQFVLKFLALLVQRGIFKTTTLFHPVVGHKHEDIDKLLH